jgi:hypothetical protein
MGITRPACHFTTRHRGGHLGRGLPAPRHPYLTTNLRYSIRSAQ